MKKLLPPILFSIILTTGQAQDVIVKKNGEEIKCKVTELGEEKIVYKKYDYLEGPDNIVSKEKVFMIKYENGTKDVFSEPPTPEPVVAVVPEAKAVVPTLKLRDGIALYTSIGGKIIPKEAANFMKGYGQDEASNLYKTGKKDFKPGLTVLSIVIATVGVLGGFYGINQYGTGTYNMNHATNNPDIDTGYNQAQYGATMQNVFWPVAAVGLGGTIGFAVMTGNGRKKVKASVALFNEKINK